MKKFEGIVDKLVDHFQDVSEFHGKTMHDDRATPGIPENSVVALNLSLIGEMFGQLCSSVSRGSVMGAAEALVNLEYVTHGASRAFGIDTRRLWRVVHEHNMKKTEGVTKTQMGKVERPVYVDPLNISDHLAAQGPIELGPPVSQLGVAVGDLIHTLEDRDEEISRLRSEVIPELESAVQELRAANTALRASAAARKTPTRKAARKKKAAARKQRTRKGSER